MASDLRKLLLSWTGTIKLFVALIKSLYLSPSLAKFSSQRHLCNLSVKGVVLLPDKGGVSIHPDEPLFWELQQRQLTPAGRAKLRERVAVEHSLSHIDGKETKLVTLALARTYLTFAVQPLSIIFMSLPKCLLTLLSCYSI